MLGALAGVRLPSKVRCLFGMSEAELPLNSKVEPNRSQTPCHPVGQASPRSQCAGGLSLFTRDPRSNIYKQRTGLTTARHTQTMQQHSASNWTIKTYVSQAGKVESSIVKSANFCFPTPSTTQIPASQLRPCPQQAQPEAPVIQPTLNIEPSADPWGAPWDAGAPDELKRFLLEVLLTSSQAPKYQTCPLQPDQGRPMPGLPPDSSSKAPSPVIARTAVTKPMTACTQELSASLETLSASSANSDAATEIADFSHAPNTQPPCNSIASSPSFVSRKRSQAESEQTDAQTVLNASVAQHPVGRPAKKAKKSTGNKSAKPALTPTELAQAAKVGVVFAKFARFAHWPAQLSTPCEQQQKDLGLQSDGQHFVVFFGQGNYQYVNQDRVISFEAGLAKYKPGKSSLDAAVKEALAYLKARHAE